MFTFLHAADIHLDSPLSGLDRYEGAPVELVRGATRRAFENLVDLVIEEDVAFCLIAGDLYDGDWNDYNTGLFFVRQMSRLREAGIPVFIVSGNHDAASKMSRMLHMPENVRIFSPNHPETHRIESLNVAIHGQSFATGALTVDIAAGYPPAVSGWFNIGLLHTSLNGRVGHDTYAPTSTGTLPAANYQYWALGHVHQYELVSEIPMIVFPGNTQGRHIRETGMKGCLLVTVDDNSIPTIERRQLHVLRWLPASVDAEGAETDRDVAARITDKLQATLETDDVLIAVRIQVVGACAAHDSIISNPNKFRAQVQADILDSFGDRIWLEKLTVRTEPAFDLQEAMSRGDALADLLRYIDELGETSELLNLISSEIDALREKLPEPLKKGSDQVVPETPEQLALLLNDVRNLLVPALLRAGRTS